jgi:hypothetical protein
MDNLPTESETVTIPAALLGGGDMGGKTGQPVTVTLRGTLISTEDGLAKIQLEPKPENEAEDMSERDRVRGMGEQADMEDY